MATPQVKTEKVNLSEFVSFLTLLFCNEVILDSLLFFFFFVCDNLRDNQIAATNRDHAFDNEFHKFLVLTKNIK